MLRKMICAFSLLVTGVADPVYLPVVVRDDVIFVQVCAGLVESVLTIFIQALDWFCVYADWSVTLGAFAFPRGDDDLVGLIFICRR